MTCTSSFLPTVLTLLQTPEAQRGPDWLAQFYAAIVDCSFADDKPQVFFGPDHFPYFSLNTPPANQPFEAYCIRILLEKLTEDGVGAAINRSGLGVDWVFTYGDLLSLRIFGAFEIRSPTPRPEEETLPKGNRGMIAQPSEDFLPSYARKVIRTYMQRMMAIPEPGVFLLSRPGVIPAQELVFSVYPENFANQEIFQGAMGALRWFLPRHYSVVSIPKDSQLVQYFQPL
jgi:hypothetical protein